MKDNHNDYELGMQCRIDRRDFIQAAGLTLLTTSLPGVTAAAEIAGKSPEHNYPPVRTGMRGSHPGSFEIAHALAREGKTWPKAKSLDEHYDLIVIGGGISGLAAAWYFREQAGKDARVLIIENHDDFGGHAKRNEFHYNGKMLLAWGGAVNMEYPNYDRKMRSFLRDLGVDLKPLIERQEYDFAAVHGLNDGIYFDADHYGEDKVVIIPNRYDFGVYLSNQVDQFPLSAESRAALKNLAVGTSDLLDGMTAEQRYEYLARNSYDVFLRDKGGLTEEGRLFFSNFTLGYWGVGTDAVPTIELIADGWPGSGRVGPVPYLNEFAGADKMTMFPDGNASLARMMVRSMIPDAASGESMMDISTASFDYDKLDLPQNRVRIRLNATAVGVENRVSQGDVSITYIQGNDVCRITAPRCILACDNALIPYLMPELPDEQKYAMKQAVRTPLVVTNVLLQNGHAINRMKMSAAMSPRRFYFNASLVGGLDLGSYQQGWNPDDPCVMQLYTAVPGARGGNNRRMQFKAGHKILLGMDFDDFEREVRVHLNGMLGPGGFDSARDIKAITVNRWPHGYTYEYSTFDDPDYAPGQAPHEIARQQQGQVAIANSDSEAKAYFNGAVEAGRRAVHELA